MLSPIFFTACSSVLGLPPTNSPSTSLAKGLPVNIVAAKGATGLVKSVLKNFDIEFFILALFITLHFYMSD